jgi:nucleoside-diphosphate-sugar epimerase
VNAEGTLNLARQCAAAGVRRFVFVSSVKVNGEERAAEQTLRPGAGLLQMFHGITCGSPAPGRSAS